MSSPTQRTLAWCRKRNMIACVVEQTIRAPGRTFKRDAFGFGDILAVSKYVPPGPAALIQVTSTGNMSSRVKKICGECSEEALAWLRSGGIIEVHGWAERVWRKKDGTKAKRKRWTLRRMAVFTVPGSDRLKTKEVVSAS